VGHPGDLPVEAHLDGLAIGVSSPHHGAKNVPRDRLGWLEAQLLDQGLLVRDGGAIRRLR
jgi:hypothetical protein